MTFLLVTYFQWVIGAIIFGLIIFSVFWGIIRFIGEITNKYK